MPQTDRSEHAGFLPTDLSDRVQETGGLSHALKNMPPACFSPRLRRGRAFESRYSSHKKRHTIGMSFFMAKLL